MTKLMPLKHVLSSNFRHERIPRPPVRQRPETKRETHKIMGPAVQEEICKRKINIHFLMM